MAKVVSPDLNHDAVDQRLLTEPMAKKMPPVITIEKASGLVNPNRKGIKGTRPQARKALKVEIAANQGERASSGRPYSSDSIVRTQRCRSDVISSTTRSRSAPEKPFRAKI